MSADEILAIIEKFFEALKTVFAKIKELFGLIKPEEESTTTA